MSRLMPRKEIEVTTQRPQVTADPSGALIVRPGEGERFARENRVVTIRVELPQLSIHEIEFDTTFEVPAHVHDHVDAMLVLEGELELLGGAQPRRVHPGTIVAVPPGVRHGFRNPGPERVRILTLHAPDGGFADLVRGT
jgi:quercetin dioxygenase-like cupin family protein